MPTALITGIAGQDGSYLAELLLEKGYEVHGLVRRSAIEDREHRLSNLRPVQDRITLHTPSMENAFGLMNLVREVAPSECYHLAAGSFVSHTLEDEISLLNNNLNTTHHLLAALKEGAPGCRVYFAGTSEMFGAAGRSPQDESTPFNPRSMYGISKVASHHLVRNYREQHGMFACTGLLYNHESPRRGHEFVTRKIISSAVRIKLGLQDELVLGNLDARRDWGYAPDYVRAMWLMLKASGPDDYVVATGETHTVRELLEIAFSTLGLECERHVRTDPKFFRPTEEVPLCGNPAKIRDTLGWKRTVTFEELVGEMIETEMPQTVRAKA